MLKKGYTISLMFVTALFLLAATPSVAQEAYDIAPAVTVVADTAPPAGFPYPKLFGYHYSAIAPQNAGTVGAIFFNNQYYLNAWNSTNLFLYDGGLGGPTTFTQVAYQGAIRDMTSDGQFLYGAAANTTIHRMNAAGISQGTITSAGGNARAIAYGSDENVFYVCDFSNNIGVINATTGALVRTLTGTSTLAGKYGMAYTTAAQVAGGPFLWVWGQGTNADPFNRLYKVNPQTGAVIDTYLFGPLPPGTTSPLGISGGAEVSEIGGRYVLLLNYQNFELQGYDMGAVIPVELTSFTASVIGSNVNLNWRTATEINNQGFEVQRSTDGTTFATVGFVEGHGTTTEAKNYSFTDKSITPGSYSYRLKQVDYDGRFEYSNIVEVNFESGPTVYSLNQNYPNPFNPSTKINFTLPVESNVTIKIFNVIGEEVSGLFKGTLNAGSHNIDFNASLLNSGVYFYSLEAQGTDGSSFSEVKKMMLTK